MKQQYLLLEDVEDIGRSGEIINAKPGFARNYLIPQQKAVPATAHALRMQARLQDDRLKKAAVDKQESEEMAKKLEGMTLKIVVKVDPEGHMYGSVGPMDVVHLFEKEGIKIDKKSVVIPSKHLKELGVHQLTLKLKEGVTCGYTLHIVSDAPEKGA